MARNEEVKEFEERVVGINRVTKVVKGGRRLRFAALVVVGDRNGRVGFGTGKAQEVPEAIRKAIESAKKNMITVPMVGTTVPHQVLGEFGGGNIWSRSRWCCTCRPRTCWCCRCNIKITWFKHTNQRCSRNS